MLAAVPCPRGTVRHGPAAVTLPSAPPGVHHRPPPQPALAEAVALSPLRLPPLRPGLVASAAAGPREQPLHHPGKLRACERLAKHVGRPQGPNLGLDLLLQ